MVPDGEDRGGIAGLIAGGCLTLLVVFGVAGGYLFFAAKKHEAILMEERARAAADVADAEARLRAAAPRLDSVFAGRSTRLEQLEAELEREREARRKLEAELATLRAATAESEESTEPGSEAFPGLPSIEDDAQALLSQAMGTLRSALAGDELMQKFGSEEFQREIGRLQMVLGDAGLDALTEALRSGTAQERMSAALLLEGWNDPRALPALEEAVSQGDDVLLQRFAAHAIALIAGDEQLPILDRIAFDESMEPGARVNAAYGLASRGSARGAELLVAMDVGDSLPPDLQGAVFPAIVSVATQAPRDVMLPYLHENLAEGSSMDRALQAMSALEELADRSSLPPLEQVLLSEHPGSVKNMAKQLINQIEGFEKYEVE